MWAELGKGALGPLVKSWQFVRQLQRDVVKDDGELGPLMCLATTGRFRRRRCTLPAFHSGEHRYGEPRRSGR